MFSAEVVLQPLDAVQRRGVGVPIVTVKLRLQFYFASENIHNEKTLIKNT